MGARPGVSLVAGLHAEGYSNFGWIGMVSIFIYLGVIVGFAQRFVNEISRASVEVQRNSLPVICILMTYISFILRWPFFDAFLRCVFPILLTIILTNLFRLRGFKRAIGPDTAP